MNAEKEKGDSKAFLVDFDESLWKMSPNVSNLFSEGRKGELVTIKYKKLGNIAWNMRFQPYWKRSISESWRFIQLDRLRR